MPHARGPLLPLHEARGPLPAGPGLPERLQRHGRRAAPRLGADAAERAPEAHGHHQAGQARRAGGRRRVRGAVRPRGQGGRRRPRALRLPGGPRAHGPPPLAAERVPRHRPVLRRPDGPRARDHRHGVAEAAADGVARREAREGVREGPEESGRAPRVRREAEARGPLAPPREAVRRRRAHAPLRRARGPRHRRAHGLLLPVPALPPRPGRPRHRGSRGARRCGPAGHGHDAPRRRGAPLDEQRARVPHGAVLRGPGPPVGSVGPGVLLLLPLRPGVAPGRGGLLGHDRRGAPGHRRGHLQA